MNRQELAEKLQTARAIVITDMVGVEWKLLNVDRQTIIVALHTVDQAEQEARGISAGGIRVTETPITDGTGEQPVISDDPDEWRDYADEPGED